MSEDSPVQPVTNQMPIVIGSDGQPYIACDLVIALLRAIANSCRNLADDLDCSLEGAGAAVDVHADALEVRAIAHTRR